MKARRQVTLELLLVLFWLTYLAASYVQSHPLPLSREAQEYRHMVDALHAGLSLSLVVQKLCFLSGVTLLLLGSVTVLTHRRIGAILLSSAALPLVATIPLGEPQPYYPAIEGALAGFPWCAASALWAGAVTLAWVFRPGRPDQHAA
jgi:hypothetical protein